MPRKTRRRRKTGGRILGKGAYGCAYKPAMRCSGELNPRDGVSKLMTREEAEKEWNEVESLRTHIDPEMRYTVYATSKCAPRSSPSPTELAEERANPKIPVCDVPGANTLIISPDGGVRLDVAGLYHESLQDALGNLFVGMMVLHLSEFVHQDIKEDNILVKDGLARFIDFGMSRNLKTLVPDSMGKRRYTAQTGFPGFSSPHLPPDWWFLQGDFDARVTRTDRRMVRTALILNMRKYDDRAMSTHHIDEAYLTLLEDVYMWSSKYPEEAAKAVDIYQLGRVCKQMESFFSPFQLNKFRVLYTRMMDRDPRKRPTSTETFVEYNRIHKMAASKALMPVPKKVVNPLAPAPKIVANPMKQQCGLPG